MLVGGVDSSLSRWQISGGRKHFLRTIFAGSGPNRKSFLRSKESTLRDHKGGSRFMKLELILGDAKVRATPPRLLFLDVFALFSSQRPSLDKTRTLMLESV